MERESFVFYRSFYEAISCLDDADAMACFKALVEYALDGKEPDVKGVAKAVFVSVRPQIDANNRRYENGCKGGRPKGNLNETKIKPNKNQNETKVKPNDNVNDNDNDNVNDKDISINYQQIADMYNETCVSFPRITKLSDSRKKAIKARLKKYSLDDIQKVFTMAEQSDFLKGSNGRNWSANFDWLMNDTNIAKVLDGNYNSNKPKKIDIDSNFRNFLEQNEVVNFGI